MLINLLSQNIIPITIFSILGTVIAFSFSALIKAEEKLKLETETMLDKRIWYSPKDVHDFFQQIDKTPEGINIYIWMHTFPDVIFPLAYGTFFGTLIFYLYDATIDWKLAIPVLATVFDLGENFTTVSMAKSYPEISTFLSWLACGCTSIKWTMFALSIIFILIGLFY